MNGTIQVERDAEGLRRAGRELFEESFFEDAMQPVLDRLGDDPEACERLLAERPPRTLSPGYYDRCAYLLDLGAAMETGAAYAAEQLSRHDVVGLQAIRKAKLEFEREHPACGVCGTRQDNRFMVQCKSCRTKFAGRGD